MEYNWIVHPLFFFVSPLCINVPHVLLLCFTLCCAALCQVTFVKGMLNLNVFYLVKYIKSKHPSRKPPSLTAEVGLHLPLSSLGLGAWFLTALNGFSPTTWTKHDTLFQDFSLVYSCVYFKGTGHNKNLQYIYCTRTTNTFSSVVLSPVVN